MLYIICCVLGLNMFIFGKLNEIFDPYPLKRSFWLELTGDPSIAINSKKPAT